MFDAIILALKTAERVGIFTHQNPDGDTKLKFGEAHEALGVLMDDVNSIILQAMNGNEEGCTPDKCASCGHCH